MTLQEAKNIIRIVQDFPKPGIGFIDLVQPLQNTAFISCVRNELKSLYQDKGITKIVAIESRGFFFSSILACDINAGLVPIRKKGKLPPETISATYQKEYGQDSIEMLKDSLTKDDVVLLHDDILATGGTIQAACNMLKEIGVKKIYLNFIGEIDFLEGRKLIDTTIETTALFHF
jgi:adenine phosphoribosyltransferase